MVTKELIEIIRREFQLGWHGIHGAAHWARVRENGLRLASVTGAVAHVVELFAVLHDSRRIHDGYDAGHGERAAEFARSLRGTLLHVSDADFRLLETACRYHSDGRTRADITVQTCWDADRLDLGRVGIKPDPVRMCTDAARDHNLLAWAYERSQRRRRSELR